MNDERPIDQLIQRTRIRGNSRMILHDNPQKVSDDDARAVIDQLKEFCMRTGRKYAQVARSLGCSASVLSQVMSFNYNGDWQSVIMDVDRWLEDEAKREAAPKPTEFVLTRVAEEVMTVAEAAITLKCIGLVYDVYGSGIGKTLALQAIAAEKPGSIYISIETANATPAGVLKLITAAIRLPLVPYATAGAHFAAIKKALKDSGRLLLVDEIHKLCGGRNDDALNVLRDLYDKTEIPMLWCGTIDLAAYLERRAARGREPLAQIRRRIGISRDLRERAEEGTGPGEPLFSVEEVRKVFARSKMRLAPDAAKYLAMMANLPDSGALGACRNLVIMATKVHEGKADVLTSDMLRAVHRLLVNRSAFRVLETRMEEPRRPLAKVG